MSYRELFEVKSLPVFQNKMFAERTDAQGCPKGDVRLVQDMNTGLIFNASFNANLLEYDTNYQNEQACSNVFQQHLDDVQKIINRSFFEKKLIEVGCGKGYFLEHLHKAGYDVTGIDPAYEGTNPRVIKACFEAGLGLSAEGIVLRHVLEHMTDPFAFLQKIATANGGKGKIYIEVPCFDWICEHRAWFDIFYEHVNYFRLADFYRMFGKIHEGGHIFGGQYLYVVADIATLQKPVLAPQDKCVFPEDFLDDFQRIVASIKGHRNAVWGGASKGAIFAIYMQRAGISIDMVIDINPAKQNKHMPGSGLKILCPADGFKQLQPGDNIIVMNRNYFQEIVTLSQKRFNYIQVDSNEF